MDKLIRVKACVLRDGDRQLAQCPSVGLDGQCFLAFDGLGQALAGQRHMHFGIAAAIDDQLVFDSLDEDAKSVVQ